MTAATILAALFVASVASGMASRRLAHEETRLLCWKLRKELHAIRQLTLTDTSN